MGVIRQDGSCRFCGGNIGGCLACASEFTRLKLEYQQMERQAVIELIKNPQFRMILNEVLAEEALQNSDAPKQIGSVSGSPARDIYQYLELEPREPEIVPETPNLAPTEPCKRRTNVRKTARATGEGSPQGPGTPDHPPS